MDNTKTDRYVVLYYAMNGSVDGSVGMLNFRVFFGKTDAIRFADTVLGIVIKTDFYYQGTKT